ncbi:MAG: DnaJ domain-containing protein [Planctomycetota bacterium]
MRNPVPDYYGVLAVDPDATTQAIRRAFRTRVLAVHPDKTAEPTDPRELQSLIQAFEILIDPVLREDYDRLLRSQQIRFAHDGGSRLRHVTESDRPVDRARTVLYLLLREKGHEALERLRQIDGVPDHFLEEFLDADEFSDVAFLLGELFERRRDYVTALRWYQHVLRCDEQRRQHRPCWEETVDRAKKILIQQLAGHSDPRVALDYLRRAEELGLTRSEASDVHRRRAQCYLDLEMRDAAARHLRAALTLQPHLKGVARLREQLADYLE